MTIDDTTDYLFGPEPDNNLFGPNPSSPTTTKIYSVAAKPNRFKPHSSTGEQRPWHLNHDLPTTNDPNKRHDETGTTPSR